MRASIVVVILSVLLSVCLADFSFSSFTQADVLDDFSTVANAQFDQTTGNSLQIVGSSRNTVGAAFHVNIDYYGNYQGDYIAPGFITQFTYQISAVTTANGLTGGAGIALVLQPNSATIIGTTGSGIGYGDSQNLQGGILNSLAVEFDSYQDANMGDPNANHCGVHSTGNFPNQSNETAVIMNLRNTTIPNILNGLNTIQHTVYVEYQAASTFFQVIFDGEQILQSNSFNLTNIIALESGTGESFLGITASNNQNTFFEIDILSWDFWAGNGTLVPDATVIYGAGYTNADYNQTNIYYIQLIDNFGYNITTNAATPTCEIDFTNGTNTGIACNVTYLSGGLYEASYFMSLVGTFDLVTTVSTYVDSTTLVVTGPPFAGTTVASGLGLSSAVAGVPATFIITTYDQSGALSTGDASFTVTLTLVSDSSVVVTGSVSAPDGTGNYTATYTVTVSGTYNLAVVLVGQTDIVGSPFTVNAVPGLASPTTTIASGANTGIAGVIGTITITPLDQFGNAVNSSGIVFYANFSGAALYNTVATYNTDGTYTVTYNLTVAGAYQIDISIASGGDSVGSISSSPLAVAIAPGPVYVPNCTASGAGLSTAQVGGTATFVIQTVDIYGNLLTTGGTLFTVTFDASFNGTVFPVVDNGDGTYTASYMPTITGTFTMTVTSGSEAISGSPFTVVVASGVASIPDCFAYGPGLSTADAGVYANFTIQAVDAFGNNITSGSNLVFDIAFDASFNGTVNTPATPNGDGTYSASYVGFNTGVFVLSVTSGGVSISGSPFNVTVNAGPASGVYSVPSGSGLTAAAAGQNSTFIITAYDQYDNPLNSYGGPCLAYLLDSAQNNYTAVCTYTTNGIYSVTYNITAAGDYQIYAFLNDIAVQGTPSDVTVSPGPLSPGNSIATGPGVSGAVAGVWTTFNITAFDAFGNIVPGDSQSAPPFLAILTKGNVTVPAIVTYLVPGTYLANYTLTAPTGSWSLNVSSSGASISNSPFTVDLVAGAVSAADSFIFPEPLPAAIAYEAYTFWVQSVDVFGNNETTDSGVVFDATVTPGGLTFPSTYYQNGQYAITLINLTGGNYTVAVALGAVQVKNSPLPLLVTAGLPAANQTIATGFGLNYSRAGDFGNFTITTYDLGGFQYTSGGQNFSAILATNQTADNSTLTANVTITDNGDGTYSGQYNVTLAAQWELWINLTSGPYAGPIKNSPFFPFVFAGENCPQNAEVQNLASNITINTVNQFQIQSKDCYGNNVLSTDVYYDVLVEGPDCSFANTSLINGTGTIEVSYMVTLPGNYTININERGTPINGSPFPVTAEGTVDSELSSTSLIFMWLMIVFIVLYVLLCLVLIAVVVVTQRKQLQRNFSNYKKIQSDSSSSSSSD